MDKVTDKQICNRIKGALSASMMSMEMELQCIHFLERCMHGGWISTKERLPRPGERVLVNLSGGNFVGEMYLTRTGHWRRYDGKDWPDFSDGQVAWWMPMPEGHE